MKVTHYESNVNMAFVENLNNVIETSCDKCEKKFKRKDMLKRHTQTVHSDHQDFKCLQCEKRFKRKDKLRRHVKTMH